MNFKYLFNILLKCFFSFVRVFLISVFVIFIICLYPVFIEPNMLIVKHKTLYLTNWSEEHNGLRIALLSDFHLSKYCITPERLEKIVEKTNKENPDFIFLLGDLDSYLIERYSFDKQKISDVLSKLNAKYGVISILGNHDFGPSVVKPILLNANIKVLENQKLTSNINGEKLIIYGLKDLWHYNVMPQKVIKREDKGNSIVVLSHNPDLFPYVPYFTSLTVSGHTHGGQIILPFLGGIFTPSIWEQRYNKGYIVENNKHLFVTSGLGFCVPLRLGNPPEIVILELYSQKTYPDKIIHNTEELKGIKHSLNSFGCNLARKIFDYINFS